LTGVSRRSCRREIVMAASKLTSDGRTILPRLVRMAVDLREGDDVGYVLGAGCVIITCASNQADDPFRHFSE